MGSMLKIVLITSITNSTLTSSLRVPIIWILIMKILRMRLIFMKFLTKISEKNRRRGYLMALKRMIK